MTKQSSLLKKHKEADSKLKRLVISSSGNMSRLTSLDSNHSCASSEGYLSPPTAYMASTGGPHSQGFYSGEESSVFADSPQSSPGAHSLHSNYTTDYSRQTSSRSPIDHSLYYPTNHTQLVIPSIERRSYGQAMSEMPASLFGGLQPEHVSVEDLESLTDVLSTPEGDINFESLLSADIEYNFDTPMLTTHSRINYDQDCIVPLEAFH